MTRAKKRAIPLIQIYFPPDDPARVKAEALALDALHRTMDQQTGVCMDSPGDRINFIAAFRKILVGE